MQKNDDDLLSYTPKPISLLKFVRQSIFAIRCWAGTNEKFNEKNNTKYNFQTNNNAMQSSILALNRANK